MRRVCGLLFACLCGGLFGACDLIGTEDRPGERLRAKWRLTTLRQSPDSVRSAERLVGRRETSKGMVYTLRFDGDVRGRADCNSYGTAYRVESDGRLSIETIRSTQVCCGTDSGEVLYFDVLAAATRYDVKDDRLRLRDESGRTLTYRRAYGTK